MYSRPISRIQMLHIFFSITSGMRSYSRQRRHVAKNLVSKDNLVNKFDHYAALSLSSLIKLVPCIRSLLRRIWPSGARCDQALPQRMDADARRTRILQLTRELHVALFTVHVNCWACKRRVNQGITQSILVKRLRRVSCFPISGVNTRPPPPITLVAPGTLWHLAVGWRHI